MLLVSTTNPGKLAEIRLALSGLPIPILSITEWGRIPEPEETGRTFAENARLKADYYFRETKLPSLADDSGLAVDALRGWPGVESARIAENDPLRIERVLGRLQHLDPVREWFRRTARFVCAMCLSCNSARREVEGTVEGVILGQPLGTGGFGYDPVFYYPPLGRSFAELTREEKNRVSHRARALERLREEISEEILSELQRPF